MESIETFKHAGRTVSIFHDEDPMSPRDYDNIATLACWHRRANLGDEQIEGGMTAKELIRSLRDRGEKVLALLPLYLYEHGGRSISTGSFSCRFDSGQVGWAYVTKSSAEKMGCVGERHEQYEPGKMRVVGTWDKAALEESIRGEVSSYDDFLTGACYGYVVEGAEGDELESCWGFVGDLNYVRSEARSAAEYSTDPAIQRNADELEARATYAAGAP